MREQAIGEPIPIWCEGSGSRPNIVDSSATIGGCAMCGRWYELRDGVGGILVVDEHERDDILARLARGDFG